MTEAVRRVEESDVLENLKLTPREKESPHSFYTGRTQNRSQMR